MAVNKNFVVKNGIEVATDLIFASSDLDKVGIGSTIPTALLEVGGDAKVTSNTELLELQLYLHQEVVSPPLVEISMLVVIYMSLMTLQLMSLLVEESTLLSDRAPMTSM